MELFKQDVQKVEGVVEIIPPSPLNDLSYGSYVQLSEDYIIDREVKYVSRYWGEPETYYKSSNEYDKHPVCVDFLRSNPNREKELINLVLPKGLLCKVEYIKCDYNNSSSNNYNKNLLRVNYYIRLKILRKNNQKIETDLMSSELTIYSEDLDGMEFVHIKDEASLIRMKKIDKALNSRSAGRRK